MTQPYSNQSSYTEFQRTPSVRRTSGFVLTP